MEVHHHPELPHGARKTFKEYLLEFLMIFLAVTMGFFAESIHERIREHKMEREYIASLVSDLKADTSKLSLFTDTVRNAYNGLDTLAIECYQPKAKRQTTKMYYAYHHYCRIWYDLKLYDKTFIQLKNSGNLRLLPGLVADSLARLDDTIEYFNDRLSYFLDAQSKAVEEGLHFFDYLQYLKANTDSSGNLDLREQGFRHMTVQPPLLSDDPAALKQFAGRIGLFRNLSGIMLQAMQGYIVKIGWNIAFFQREYDLPQ